MPPRTCFVANRMEGGIIYIATPDVPNPWELMQFDESGKWESYDEETFRLLTGALGFGFSYLRPRAEVEEEYLQRFVDLDKGETGENFREVKP